MSRIIKSNDGKVIIEAPNNKDWSFSKGKLTDSSMFFRSKNEIFVFEIEEGEKQFIKNIKDKKSVILSYLYNDEPAIDEVEVEIEI